MSSIVDNPYAIYINCDGAMSYDSKNTSGVGIVILFPDFVDLETIEISVGCYERANIERVELEAILQSMKEILIVYKKYNQILRSVGAIIIRSDRLGLSDRTKPHRIAGWRRNDWKNHEGKEIKNKDLLGEIDRTRNKIYRTTRHFITIEYIRKNKNKRADRLAKLGKIKLPEKRSIATKGIKVAPRLFDGDFVNYQRLKIKNYLTIRIYKKETVGKRIEISAEFINGTLIGRKITLYIQQDLESRLHRQHIYKIRIKNIFTHYIEIYKTIKEIKK